LLLLMGASRVLSATLRPLGDLPGGTFSSGASAVSADGSVVVGQSSSASGSQAFRWTSAGGMVGLGDLPGGIFSSAARGVSDDGLVVVGEGTSPNLEAFRWTAGSGMVGLGRLPGTFDGRAFGVSGDGSVVVGQSGRGAFRWTAGGGMVSLPGAPVDSIANAVSSDGSVVVGQALFSSGNIEAFRWTSSGGMVSLGDLPGGSSESGANGVSADGSVVVGQASSASGTQAFRWASSAGMVGLSVLPGAYANWATGVSGDGSVVVGITNFDTGASDAFRWTNSGGMERLWDVLVAVGVDPAASGWTRLNDARGVSLDGSTIVGTGMRNGNFEAFVATVPEPATVVLFGVGLFCIGVASRRRVRRLLLNSWLRLHDLMRKSHATRIVCATAAVFATITLTAHSASAAYITVYGGPIDTTATLGYTYFPYVVVNDSGTAVGNMDTYGAPFHSRIFRWDGSGMAPDELGNLGLNVPGVSTITASARAINSAGTAAGYARKWDGSVNKGYRAIRWNPSAAAATELGNLGTDSSGVTHSQANAINDGGTAVGVARKYDGAGVDMGLHPVRWDASSTAATELENLGANNSDMGSIPLAINNAGTAVGYVAKYDDNISRDTGIGFIVDLRAVRWDASGAVTELESLGADPAGKMGSQAEAINSAGTAIGYSHKYGASGNYMGLRAVRWDASGTAATELQGLAADPRDNPYASAINDAGTIVGAGPKNSYGYFPIRWDPSGTSATELGNLGTDENGQTSAAPQAINNAGVAVGWAYDRGSSFLGNRAVYWGLDGAAVDLNTLIDPTSGWLLWSATDISDTGWIAGAGFFDPDGAGGQPRVRRMFLMHVPATAVPEPATVVFFGVGLFCVAVTSRRFVRRSLLTAES
jgi:probable HAF family extracellular repeat protein